MRYPANVSLAPMALASDGSVLLNIAEFQDDLSIVGLARTADASGLTVFVGVAVPPGLRARLLGDIGDAASDIAGRLGEHVVRRPRPSLPADDAAELPQLDEWVAEVDEELADVVDAVVRLDARARQRQASIEQTLEVARGCLDDGGVVSLLEEARGKIAEREADLLCAVARWAFAEGRRPPCPTGPTAEGSS
jgi:hypothetical protein